MTEDHPHDPPAAADTRTDLQRAEDDERAAFEGLDVAGKVRTLIDPLLGEARNQVRAGGPVTSSMIGQLEAIHALVR